MATFANPSQAEFHQIHIDAARNSTDDFNIFHDKNRWHSAPQNPFGGPIVLGFQLACYIEYQIKCYRSAHQELACLDTNNLRFSNYQFNFARALKASESAQLEIKPSRRTQGGNAALGNRLLLKSAQGLVLMGYKKESHSALYALDWDSTGLPPLNQLPDRSYIPGTAYFLKRKYMNTGNAKNFLSGSLAEQSDYIDELEDRVQFPETFPIGLLSCALLERAHLDQHDFVTNPMVYTTHQYSIDRALLRKMKSNDVLHMLVKPAVTAKQTSGLGETNINQVIYECMGIMHGDAVLYQAKIGLAPLADIIAQQKVKSG